MGEQEMDVHFACTEDSETRKVAQRENATFHSLFLSRKLSPFQDLISLIACIRLIKKVRPDIVHTHSPKAGIVGILAARLCNVTLRIHTVAGLPLVEAKGAKKKLLVFVEKIAYHFAHYILPNSKVQMDYIISEKIYTNTQKLIVLGNGGSNGVDLTFFNKNVHVIDTANKFKSLHNINEGDVVLSFVGRLNNYKGINELIEAFRSLNVSYPTLKLILVGPYEDLNPLLQNTLSEINNNLNIIAVGHQEDIRPYLCASDIFVFPSYREGFPQSLMQAGAMGLPSIATDINGCNEVVKDGITGLLIEPKDTESLTKAIVQLVEDKKLRIEMGTQSEEYIKRNYEQGRFWKLVHDFYIDKLFNKSGE